MHFDPNSCNISIGNEILERIGNDCQNVKTAEPIGPKFFVGSRVTPGKVYEWSNFQKFASIKIRFLKILKIHNIFFRKSAKFLFCLQCTQIEHVHNWNRRWSQSALRARKKGAKRPEFLVMIYFRDSYISQLSKRSKKNIPGTKKTGYFLLMLKYIVSLCIKTPKKLNTGPKFL